MAAGGQRPVQNRQTCAREERAEKRGIRIVARETTAGEDALREREARTEERCSRFLFREREREREREGKGAGIFCRESEEGEERKRRLSEFAS